MTTADNLSKACFFLCLPCYWILVTIGGHIVGRYVREWKRRGKQRVLEDVLFELMYVSMIILIVFVTKQMTARN